MLYVFHGSDIAKGVEKSHALINSLRTKRPDAAYENISADNWNPAIIEGHLGGQGLFSSKYIIFLDRLSENEEAKLQLIDFIPAMQESPNIFIVLEGAINAELKKAFVKDAEKIVVSEEPAAAFSFGRSSTGKREFNIFSLADAVGARDPIKAWSIYRQAIDNGLEVESIAGTLFWQVKSMMLASQSQSAGDAGLNPFVFSKAKKAAGNYSAEELGGLLERIMTIYHEGHRGMTSIELTIERGMLTL